MSDRQGIMRSASTASLTQDRDAQSALEPGKNLGLFGAWKEGVLSGWDGGTKAPRALPCVSLHVGQHQGPDTEGQEDSQLTG